MPDETRMQLNEDGSVTIPLAGTPDEEGNQGPGRSVTLRRPTVLTVARLYDLVDACEEKLPALPTGDRPSKDAPAVEQIEFAQEWNRAARERKRAVHSADSPYVQAFVEAMALLGEPVDVSELYGWALDGQALAQVINHFTVPFVGGTSTA